MLRIARSSPNSIRGYLPYPSEAFASWVACSYGKSDQKWKPLFENEQRLVPYDGDEKILPPCVAKDIPALAPAT
jgi:hypothetical protein